MSTFADYCQALNGRNSILLVPPTPNLTKILKVPGIFSKNNKKIAASCYWKDPQDVQRGATPRSAYYGGDSPEVTMAHFHILN